MFYVVMFLVGAAFGSFLCCQARRLNRKEMGQSKLPARSVCLKCRKQLKWHENIPIVSWLALKGRCKKCGAKIGGAEILAEVGVAVAFLLLSTTIRPATASFNEWSVFLAVLVLTLNLAFLAIYDGLYGELPSLCLTFTIICAILVVILKQWSLFSVGSFSGVYGALSGGALLGGLYLLLYMASRGKWVGDGDFYLAFAIGLALGSSWLALLALLLANVLALVVALPGYLKQKKQVIYFGPYLAAAFVVVYSFGSFLTNLL